MIRIILITSLTLALALGFGTLSIAKRGGSSGHSGSSSGHSSSHIDSDDSGHHGRGLLSGGLVLTFNAEGRHQQGNGLYGHNHGDGDESHRHGEAEHDRHGVGEIEAHHSSGHY